MASDQSPDSSHRPSLALATLGGASLRRADSPPSFTAPSAADVETLGPGKPLALVTYLACAPRRTASREHLVDLLWADLDPDKARHALRQTIWYLRQILGSDGLTTHGTELALAAPLRLDRDDFLAAVGIGDLAAAASLYQGDFLAGFAVPGGIDFEHWADVERQRLRAAFLRVAETLVRQWLDGGRFREAQQLARRARDTARGSEAAWRLLLESLLASGELLGFAMEAGGLQQMLVNEGREPDPATRALLARSEEAPARSRSEPAMALVPALVGRAQPFSAIIAAWERVSQSGGVHLHLSAPAGLGKTRLLSDARRRLRDLGARAVSLRANPGDRAIPFSFAGELARTLAELPGAAGVSPSTAGTLISLHPSLSGRFSAAPDASAGEEALRRRSAALGELISVVSDEQPCAILLDDLHWADTASRQALRPLIDRLSATRVLLVTSARPGTSLDAEGQDTVRIVLEPLSSPQILELLASLGQLPDQAWSQDLAPRLLEVTGGSPLLVLETVQLALDRDLLRLSLGHWGCPSPEALDTQLRSGSALRTRIERLEREPRWVLLLLALAGTPLGLTQLIRAAGHGREGVEAALLLLEKSGLAEHAGERWQPAHDEIAACAESLAAEAEIRSAHLGLGEMYAGQSEAGRTVLARAGAHLQRSGASPELRAVFVRYVSAARAEGDGRRLNSLAEQFLDERPATEGRDLVRTMGRLNRVRYSGGRTVGATIVVTAALATALLALRGHARPDITLYGRGVTESGAPAGWALPLIRDRWRGENPLGEQPPLTTIRHAPWLPIDASYLLKRPGKEQWAATLTVSKPDSGTNDIFLFYEDGHRERLTYAPRDDSPLSWSPDGRWLAMSTARWSQIGADEYDVAILDPETKSIRPLVRDPELEVGAYWSPDGTRIGFMRRWKTRRRPEEACWATLEREPTERCVTPEWGLLLNVSGWVDPAHLLAVIDSSGQDLLVQLHAETGAIKTLRHATSNAWPSSDGAWIIAFGEIPGELRPLLYLFATDEPDRVVAFPPELPQTGQSGAFWGEPIAVGRMLDTLRILEAPDTVDVGATFQLSVSGRGPSGGTVPLLVPPRWYTTDTSIASVEPGGVLRARRPGTIWVHASASGWRVDSVAVTIAERPTETVLKEGWDSTWPLRWLDLGSPAPQVVSAPGGGRAFLNNGDGSYFSGAVTRESWSAATGLGIDIDALTPVVRSQWQAWQTMIAELGSLAELITARAQDKFPPGGHGDPLRQCAIRYPAGEGMTAFDRLSLFAGGGRENRGVVGPWIRESRWYRVRIQILPDGRCGVAVNGIPIWLSETRMRLDLPLRVALGSSSVGVRVLHGPLEIWRGVKTDLDWSVLDSLDGHPLPLAKRPGKR